jgi:hypothetical protein
MGIKITLHKIQAIKYAEWSEAYQVWGPGKSCFNPVKTGLAYQGES